MKKINPPQPGTITYYDMDGNIVIPDETKYYPTMSLRDYFAAQALAGTLTNQEGLDKVYADFNDPYNGITKNLAEYLAEKIYVIADAMLKERNKQ